MEIPFLMHTISPAELLFWGEHAVLLTGTVPWRRCDGWRWHGGCAAGPTGEPEASPAHPASDLCAWRFSPGISA